jgi:hypothetical protein
MFFLLFTLFHLFHIFLVFPLFLFGFPFLFTFVLSLFFGSCGVSSLAYPNLLGIKGLIVVVVVV